MTRALAVSILTVAATIAAALGVTPSARATQAPELAPAPLHEVESRIEAQVDARLHTILEGLIAQNS